MKISGDLLKDKKLAGKDKEGKPIIMVETHGGLFAFFRKASGGGYETVAAAPHKAVAAWMCEVKCHGVRWEPGFMEVKKSEEDRREQLRQTIFGPSLDLAKTVDGIPVDPSDYFAYDTRTGEVSVVDLQFLVEGVRNRTLGDEVVVRRVDLDDKPAIARYHPDVVTKSW